MEHHDLREWLRGVVLLGCVLLAACRPTALPAAQSGQPGKTPVAQQEDATGGGIPEEGPGSFLIDPDAGGAPSAGPVIGERKQPGSGFQAFGPVILKHVRVGNFIYFPILTHRHMAPVVVQAAPEAAGGETVHLPLVPGDEIPLPTEAPTAIPTATPAPDEAGLEPRPRLDVQVVPIQLVVGERLVVTGNSEQIGNPFYYLFVREEGSNTVLQLARATFSGQSDPVENTSRLVRFVEGSGSPEEAAFVLEAIAPGTVYITLSVTGEVEYPEGTMWVGISNYPVEVVITGR